ncbi:hypothetical protein D3C80_1770650 [compost metagenome]
MTDASWRIPLFQSNFFGKVHFIQSWRVVDVFSYAVQAHHLIQIDGWTILRQCLLYLLVLLFSLFDINILQCICEKLLYDRIVIIRLAGSIIFSETIIVIGCIE